MRSCTYALTLSRSSMPTHSLSGNLALSAMSSPPKPQPTSANAILPPPARHASGVNLPSHPTADGRAGTSND